MKNRVAIYQREATEMLQNIAQYPGLTEEQLCRFFPEKESTAKILLSHMLKEGRAYRADNGRYYINQEIQNGADDTLSRCIWVLLDFIEQVEYHTAGEFPVEVLCFANGQLYEIVPIPRGKEALLWMLCNPDATKQFHALLLQSFCPSPKDSAIENDAVTEDGTPILFAYQPDLPKLYRFYAALELHKRSGIIVCFDFQEDALRPFCGSRIKLQTIDFSDFERRFLNSP